MLLLPEQTQEFNEMFEKGYYCAEPLYSSLVALEVATIHTEDEALNLVLKMSLKEQIRGMSMHEWDQGGMTLATQPGLKY